MIKSLFFFIMFVILMVIVLGGTVINEINNTILYKITFGMMGSHVSIETIWSDITHLGFESYIIAFVGVIFLFQSFKSLM